MNLLVPETSSVISAGSTPISKNDLENEDFYPQDLSFQLSKSSVSVSQDRNGINSFKSSGSKIFKSFINPNKTISDNSINQTLNYQEPPTELIKHPEAEKSQIFEISKENQIHFTPFASPNKVFCADCKKDVYSLVKAKESRHRPWGSLGEFLTTFICCEPKSSNQKEMWHYCSKCSKILAKVVSKL